ncbi:unnamed protein product, partial [marine sediment metagenome]
MREPLSVPDSIVEELRKELKGKRIRKDQLEEIITEIVNSYEFAQIDPGSAVGTVAAQSIGEPGTVNISAISLGTPTSRANSAV